MNDKEAKRVKVEGEIIEWLRQYFRELLIDKKENKNENQEKAIVERKYLRKLYQLTILEIVF